MVDTEDVHSEEHRDDEAENRKQLEQALFATLLLLLGLCHNTDFVACDGPSWPVRTGTAGALHISFDWVVKWVQFVFFLCGHKLGFSVLALVRMVVLPFEVMYYPHGHGEPCTHLYWMSMLMWSTCTCAELGFIWLDNKWTATMKAINWLIEDENTISLAIVLTGAVGETKALFDNLTYGYEVLCVFFIPLMAIAVTAAQRTPWVLCDGCILHIAGKILKRLRWAPASVSPAIATVWQLLRPVVLCVLTGLMFGATRWTLVDPIYMMMISVGLLRAKSLGVKQFGKSMLWLTITITAQQWTGYSRYPGFGPSFSCVQDEEWDGGPRMDHCMRRFLFCSSVDLQLEHIGDWICSGNTCHLASDRSKIRFLSCFNRNWTGSVIPFWTTIPRLLIQLGQLATLSLLFSVPFRCRFGGDKNIGGTRDDHGDDYYRELEADVYYRELEADVATT